MAVINYKKKEVSCKIVYFGPSLGGKTTNIQHIHTRTPEKSRSDLKCVNTEGDRTLFFDFFSLDISKINSLQVKFQIYGVPGQSYYRSTRKMVLSGADGIVFVADSDEKRLSDNIESFIEMKGMLEEYEYDSHTVPLVFQWNKRDLDEKTPVDQLERTLNKWRRPSFEAIAVEGKSVIDTFKKVCVDVVARLENDLTLQHKT